MTDVFYDSWAWIEVYSDTAAGRKLDANYGANRAAIHTSLWSIAEVGAKAHLEKGATVAREAMDRMVQDAAEAHGITFDDIHAAAALRTELRRTSGKPANLGGAVILGQARRLRLPLISGDPAFKGQKDVRPT